MFTGIVEEIGEIVEADAGVLRVRAPQLSNSSGTCHQTRSAPPAKRPEAQRNVRSVPDPLGHPLGHPLQALGSQLGRRNLSDRHFNRLQN